MFGCLWTHVRKQPIIALYYESENELKFYNLEARLSELSLLTDGIITKSNIIILLKIFFVSNLSYNTALRVKCEELAQKWIGADWNDLSQFKESDCSALTSVQIIEFLAILLNHKVCTILNIEMD